MDFHPDLFFSQANLKVLSNRPNCAVRILASASKINTVENESMLVHVSHLRFSSCGFNLGVHAIKLKGSAASSTPNLDSQYLFVFDFVVFERIVVMQNRIFFSN